MNQGGADGRTRREEVHPTMASIDREQVAADRARRGFGCDLWTDSPGRRWEDFIHATDELLLVLEGEMEFEIAGQVCHPAIGDELLVPAGAIHSARNIGATTARWLYGYRRGHNEVAQP
jgi:mannose-6-phosphate isomerase-like protein (cupin superfamily)